MAQYRIVTNGRMFRVQQWTWFLWISISIPCSQKEAEDFLEWHQSLTPWRVV